MNTRHSFRWLWLTVSVMFLAIPFTYEPAATQSQGKAVIKTDGGLTIVTFDVDPGKIIVRLPDDMAAGDPISGTVVIVPKGDTAEEKAKNQNALNETVLDLGGTKIQAGRPTFSWTPPVPQPGAPPRYNVRITDLDLMLGMLTVNPNVPRDPNVTPTFVIPTLGQQGRAVEITGPFDGNASNTTLSFGPASSTFQDFEKNTENVSGGFGLIRPLAESPRKMVFESPTNVTGPMQLLLREGDAKSLAPFRNVGVRLSAPKTNLLRGERTTLTVEVTGLEGIQKDVPLQLDSKGVITMDGGNFQNLRISPTEVNQAGRYTTARAITGQQAGAFTVTATVIVGRYDMKLQDDVEPAQRFFWNTFTGDYFFTTGGAPLLPGGQPPSGGTTSAGGAPKPPMGGTSLSGTGKPAMKGCIITLSHNAPDRRVFARLDVCNKTGDASVETTSPKTKVAIADKNTTDNPSGSN
jgi:hypothetical protein